MSGDESGKSGEIVKALPPAAPRVRVHCLFSVPRRGLGGLTEPVVFRVRDLATWAEFGNLVF
jgi:hypothetical protein